MRPESITTWRLQRRYCCLDWLNRPHSATTATWSMWNISTNCGIWTVLEQLVKRFSHSSNTNKRFSNFPSIEERGRRQNPSWYDTILRKPRIGVNTEDALFIRCGMRRFERSCRVLGVRVRGVYQNNWSRQPDKRRNSECLGPAHLISSSRQQPLLYLCCGTMAGVVSSMKSIPLSRSQHLKIFMS